MPNASPSPKRQRGRPREQRASIALPKMPMAVIPPVTMRPPQAARHVGVSLSLMKKWIAEQRVRSTTIGRVRLVFVASLNALESSADGR